MLDNERVIEARGEGVEDAIEAGLAQLGVSRDKVNVDVLEEGSRGFLGLGSRPAVVRLTMKLAAKPTVVDTTAVDTPADSEQKSELLPATPSEPEPAVTAPATAVSEAEMETAVPTEQAQEGPSEGDVALGIVQTLLTKLQVQASSSVRLSEPDDVTGESLPIIDINGRDLGVLIGPQGATLNAIQYITRLMAGHALQRRASFIIDVESYRERRKEALARLAERMAGKVIQGGRPISLEPMPANERRIIHVALRDHTQVYTQSMGEGRRRQVRILPKRD